jgi:phage tail sheath gpL-like
MAVSTAVDPSAVARVLGIKTEYKNLAAGNVLFLPQRVALFGQGTTALQGTYSNTKAQVFSAFEVGNTYGFGSPLHLAALQLLPVNGDGLGTIPLTVYPLDDDASAVIATGDITPTVVSITQDFNVKIKVNNILSVAFTVEVGDVQADIVTKMAAAVAATSELPIIGSDGTTKLDVTSKWKGASANDIYLEIEEDIVGAVTWAFTQPTGGATNPDVSSALAQIGIVWESMLLNCLDVADTTTLDLFSTWGEGRWGALVHAPAVVFTGNLATTVANAITVPDARKTDRINAQLVAPGSKDLPFVTAARQLARIAKLANTNPPHDYGSQKATGLTAGLDSEQWDYIMQDAAVKGGSSTINVKDNVINIADVVTFYHPTGDPLPAYRFVVDIVKLQTIIFNTALIFNTDEWDGAPLIPDDQPTINATAKKPKMAKAEVAAMIDSLGLNAFISDPKTAKESIIAAINETNPKRLDLTYTVALSGNTNIKSVDLNFGFYFGTAPVVG